MRAVIKILNVEKVSGIEIHRPLCAVYSIDKVMSKWQVYKWITSFDEGWMNTQDEPQSGCQLDGVNNETIACMLALINADCCFTGSNIF